MKRKMMTITYICPDDKAALGETEIMGFALQRLGEFEAYDINMQASTMNIAEPAAAKVPELDIKIPEFMKRRPEINPTESLQTAGKGNVYGKTI